MQFFLTHPELMFIMLALFGLVLMVQLSLIFALVFPYCAQNTQRETLPRPEDSALSDIPTVDESLTPDWRAILPGLLAEFMSLALSCTRRGTQRIPEATLQKLTQDMYHISFVLSPREPQHLHLYDLLRSVITLIRTSHEERELTNLLREIEQVTDTIFYPGMIPSSPQEAQTQATTHSTTTAPAHP